MQRGLLFEVEAVPYGVKVVCAFGVSDARVKRELTPKLKPQKDVWELPADCEGQSCMFAGGGHMLIRLRHFPAKPQHYGTLAHEVFHTVMRILRRAGCEPTYEAEEAYAYLLSYITEKIYERLS